jgi:hypothetical protein
VTWGDSTSYDGTIINGTRFIDGSITDFEAGSNSRAFDFNVGEYAELPSGVNPSSGGYSIVFWFRSTNSTWQPNGYMLSNWSVNGFLYSFRNDQLDWRAFAGGFDNADAMINFDFEGQTSWTHVALVVNEGSQVELYIDGVSFGTDSLGGSYHTADDPPYINNKGDTSSRGTEAQLDDLRFYNTDLTATQVTDIYNNTKP